MTVTATGFHVRARVTPIVSVPSPQTCCTALVTSSLFTELPSGFPQLRGHAGGFGVRDFY